MHKPSSQFPTNQKPIESADIECDQDNQYVQDSTFVMMGKDYVGELMPAFNLNKSYS